MTAVIRMSKLALAVLAALFGFVVATATAAPSVSWSVQASAGAPYMRPGGVESYSVVVTNTGTAAAAEATITDKLPAGVTASNIELEIPSFPGFNVAPFVCTPVPASGQVRCEYPGLLAAFGVGPIQPGQQLRMTIDVKVETSAAEGPAVDEALVEGAGAQASALAQSTISLDAFGVTKFTLQTTRSKEVQGPLSRENWGFVNEPVGFTQAGGHPNGQNGGADALTAVIEFDNELVQVPNGEGGRPELVPEPTRDPRDIVVSLPPGLLGNPTAVPRCALKVALSGTYCPSDTQVGVAVIHLGRGEGLVGPIVNVTPEAGQSAEFVIETAHNISAVLTGHVVHTSKGYGLTVVTNSVPMIHIYLVETSFWGVPAASVHDPERGLVCQNTPSNIQSLVWRCGDANGKFVGGEPSSAPPTPFLIMPSDCSAGPQPVVLRTDSWEAPGRVREQRYEGYAEKSFTMPGATGCNLLQFAPGIGVEPDTSLADAPVGLTVGLTVPQFEEAGRFSTPQLRDASVRLPEGVSISPGIVDGIRACEESGPEGINFTGPESEEVGANGELQLAAGHCPDASIVGTAVASTPLLPEKLEGHVYLARPRCGGPGESACTVQDAREGRLYQLYLELGGTGQLASSGVHIKVRLRTEADPVTGQLTTLTEDDPQLPFSKLEVKLNGGPRAPLDNPPVCGSAQTAADFTPWAISGVTDGLFMPGLPVHTLASSSYPVEGCANLPGLSPGFVAGTVIANAGKFSSFTLNLSRKDREQYVRGVQLQTPPGLLGMLSSVPLCVDAQANSGMCPEASKIGTTRVTSGAGSHPFEIEGSMYLTGLHDGAPFGLSIVTHAVAGPFNLGLVVVRARIEVDQHDSTLTVTTDETGPYALPQIIFGVPLRLQRITVNVDRQRFMFNPTNCSAQKITAKISGSGGAVADVSSPFAVGGCKSLGFKPKFTVSTNGRTSRKLGASLDTKLAYPTGAMGNDANIAKVKVSLPRQLPSYLPTLQKACVAETFENNPAACPKDSIVGIARTHTPLLPVELEGPVYFVSHGGEAFPSLIIVLEGDNIRVDLVGSTFISKGTTSSTFKTVPDVPVNSFELYLPQGRNHALAANGNLCKVRGGLVMPTEFVAQNGKVIHQKTKVMVTGCGSGKASASRHRKRPSRRKGRR
jgi:uncharacterized repeat protein (TIGR01451 family)